MNALFYSPGDTERLAALLLGMLDDPVLRRKLAKNFRNVLRNLISFEEDWQRHLELFREARELASATVSLAEAVP